MDDCGWCKPYDDVFLRIDFSFSLSFFLGWGVDDVFVNRIGAAQNQSV